MKKLPPTLKLKIGKMFEASASGVFAISSLVAVVLFLSIYFGSNIEILKPMD